MSSNNRHVPHGSNAVADKILTGQAVLPRDIDDMPSSSALRHEAMLINEISLLLSEKRTSLAVMRTGIAILAIPISVVSLLVVISRYYDPLNVLYLLGPLLVICAFLTFIGSLMVFRAWKRFGHINHVIADLKRQNTNLRQLCLAMNDLVKGDSDF